MQQMNLWSDSLHPRIEARAFGVPIKRIVLKVKRQKIERVELLTEVSKTENGKFYIVVFKRFVKKKKQSSPSRRRSALDGYPMVETDLFDDIYIKELQGIQAIQLLKRFDNDLDKLISCAVKYNSRFEKVDFSGLHKQIIALGDLHKLQMKES